MLGYIPWMLRSRQAETAWEWLDWHLTIGDGFILKVWFTEVVGEKVSLPGIVGFDAGSFLIRDDSVYEDQNLYSEEENVIEEFDSLSFVLSRMLYYSESRYASPLCLKIVGLF